MLREKRFRVAESGPFEGGTGGAGRAIGAPGVKGEPEIELLVDAERGFS